MFAPSSAGNSSDDWSLGSGGSGGRSHRRSANTTPKNSVRGGSRDGGRSIVTASGVSRSAILPSAQVNLSSLRRPTTGLARVENLASSSSSTTSKSNMPIVESVGYYQAMIQAKIDETSKEMKRLRSETEMADVHSEPRMALESRHDALLNTVRGLEGDLADYNLAREYVRSGSSPGDVKKFTLAIISTNKKMEKDIDAVFFKRKKVEDELSSVEAEVARLNAVLESKILDGDDEKMDDYRSSLEQVKATITEMEQQEDDIVLIRHKLRTMELNDQGLGSQCLKKKKHVGNMKKLLEQVGEDIKLAQMADDEARECLLGKIVGLQLSTKELEEELSMLENELKTLHEIQKKNRIEKLMGGAAMACDRLFKKENSFKQYLERLPKMQTQLEEERGRLLSTIETLRCDISRTAKWMSDMDLPSKEEMELMRNDVAFARKHLDANQETMSILRQQKKKLMDELAHVTSLDGRITSEIDELDEQTASFVTEMSRTDYGNVKDSANATRLHLVDMNDKHARGIQILDNLMHASLSSPQQRMNILNNSSEWRELQDLKSKLCTQGRVLLKLQESRTDYGNVKAECLQLMEEINQRIISSFLH